MDTPLAVSLVHLGLGVSIFLAVITAFFAPLSSRKQARAALEQTQELVKHSQELVQQCQELAEQDLELARQNQELAKQSQELAREDRLHLSRPVIVPTDEGINLPKMPTPHLYDSDGNFQWTVEGPIRIELQNIGSGPVFNIHCVLYGSERLPFHQFVSWDNGPLKKESSPKAIRCEHSQRMRLSRNDSIDGVHSLYDESPDLPSNPMASRMARLTITYHDLFGVKYVSIFNYTKEKRWVKVTIRKIPFIDGKPPIDLKELNSQRQ